jgi:hypothetical protein
MSTKQRIFIPTYISSVDYQPARVQPRLLFYNGLKDCEPWYVASGSRTLATNEAFNAFPYFDNYSGQNTTTSSLSLLFFNEEAPYGVPPTASLYTEYWEDYVELLYNPRTRLINGSAIIPLADYFKMELNDIVDFRGNYYHLRAINDYSLTNGECKIQLLGPILPDALNLITEDDCSFAYSISAIDCDFQFTSSIITTTTTLPPVTTTTTTLPGQRIAIRVAFCETNPPFPGDLNCACSNAQSSTNLVTAYVEAGTETNPIPYNTMVFANVTGSTLFGPAFRRFSDGNWVYVVDTSGEIERIELCNTTTTSTTLAPSTPPQSVQNFLTASGITDTTISNALTTLVNGMVSNGIWNKMYAVYPFVGGTQNTNKWNLINTGSYTLAQSGNWNYSSNGVSSSKANDDNLNTNFAVPPELSGSLSLGVYNRTSGPNGYDIGTVRVGNTGNQIALISQFTDNRFYFGIPTQIGGVSAAVTSSLGFFQASRTSNSKVVGYRNGTQLGINNTTINEPYYYYPLVIGNVNIADRNDDYAPSNRQYAFAYIGQGLSDSELVAYNTLVQQFQTSLSRNV